MASKRIFKKKFSWKKLRCEFDYSKTGQKDDLKRHFYSVFRPFDAKDQAKEIESAASTKNKENKNSGKEEEAKVEIGERNVNVELLEQGLATLMNPRVDDEVSKYLDSYKVAEGVGKERKVGLSGTTQPPNSNFSDLISATKTKKREFINFLVGQKSLPCVVEYCFAANKYKVRIEKK